MKIKKYEGKNEKEIMNQIKDELGPNAIVLNIKTIKASKFLSFFIKDRIEITAAVDELENTHIEKNNTLEQLQSKISHMEHMITSRVNEMNQLQEDISYEIKSTANRPKSKIVDLIYEHLINQDVEHEVAMALLTGTEDIDHGSDVQEVVRIVYNNICLMIGDVQTIDKELINTDTPHIIFFIGPTGVGKTTSLAKLTADFSLRKKSNIALITADTYRIAAIDQLRTYAEILSVPLKVVYSAQELIEGVKSFKDKDFIFIDTAGRSHKNREQLSELQEILDAFSSKKVYLVLSSTTKFKDLMSIVKTYSSICEEYSVIITKTDETTSVGTILNLRYHIGKPLSYISFGQNVPDDIEIINSGKYAKMLLGSLENE